MIYHLTAKNIGHSTPFHEREPASWFWKRMRGQFRSETLALVLMPDHFHWVARLERPERAKVQVSRLLARVAPWEKFGKPEKLPNRLHIQRTFRYVYLNPCRDQLCRVPLEWTWSTYRDLFGASAYPWIPYSRIQNAMESTDSLERLHRYVSSDPSVALTGTSMPFSARPIDFAQYPLVQIQAAAVAALRAPLGDLQRKKEARRLFLHLAAEQGWGNSPALARHLDITPRSVQRNWTQRPRKASLQAALLCLGDERLTRIVV